MNAAPLALLILFLLACALWWRERRLARRLLRERSSARAELEASFAEREALARERLAAEERERILADLHDDIGARLLNLIHASPSAVQADIARTILQDLRDVVSRSCGAPGTLHEVLQDIRGEAEQRLLLVGGRLDWQQAEDLPDPPLAQGQALHLFRIVREALSNALHHGAANHVRIRVVCSVDQLVFEITDDGAGSAGEPEGRGSDNMRRRAAELRGTIAWNTDTLGGTQVLLRFPLPGTRA
ncbi:sensor histidine kinase [Sinimarinibacterium thermocellulolyticum]|uniref:ATP-binding protein n=1 Tax=Sinimarinibacterium thermocellulolyticum TaxID=3170016 RepID=A0ABV2ABB8_9GAMM